MKSVLSSIDLICVARELIDLKGASVQKIYHVGDELLFHLFHDGESKVLRVVVGKLIHLTSYKKENPMMPSNFCMYLRKYLKGARIVGVSQPHYERIIVLRLSRGDEITRLVIELFGSGNVILMSDDAVIKQCLKIQRFSARVIKPHEHYEFPPSSFDLSTPDFVSFRRVIKSSERVELVKALAVDVGLGGTYAEEACLIAGADKLINIDFVKDDVLKKVYKGVLSLVKKAKYLPLAPRVILNGEQVVDVVPFELSFYKGKHVKEFESFNDALDFFYARSEKLDFKVKRDQLVSDRRSKLIDQLTKHEQYVQHLREESALIKDRAFSLKNNLYTVEKVIDSLLSARKQGFEWSDIKEMIERERAEGSSEAALIKDLRPSDNLIILDLADGIELTLNGSIRNLMTELFDQAKKLESKIDGALAAVERARHDLDSFSEDDVTVEAPVPKRVDSSGREWYERFKWFRTSAGELVIAGRNADQNEELIRKYLQPDDLVFHAEIQGAPFTILRNGRKASSESKLQAAQFAAAHSSAWRKQVVVDVFYVQPYQLSKEADVLLAKGSFMIEGRKEYFKNLKLELCLGVEVLGELSYRLISGPKSVVKSRASIYFTLEPGRESQNDIVRQLIERFKQKGYTLSFEDLKAALPDGDSRFTI